jgi:UDP-GlcNAc:undecaprenyl-phosphate GlcNAc-1-phosphate transferase
MDRGGPHPDAMYSPTQLLLIYSGLFFASLVFSILVNSLFMRFARTLGIRGTDHLLVRWSSTAKPAFGGIGFFMLFLVSFTLHGVIFPGRAGTTLRPELFGLLASTALGFLMGLADDAYNTRPLLKFLAQVACGVILIVSGTSIDLFDTEWADQLLTILWVVGMMNSINMLDNMDGITTSVSIGVLCAILVQMQVLHADETVHTILIIGVLAALAGFLFFNWHPSRMFMGDTGSQFLGVFLAYLAIRFLWNTPSPAGAWETPRQIIMPLIALLLPIVDTTVVSINRIARGTSPFVGGRDHTTHHLSYAGLSDAQVALTFVGLSILNVFLVFVACQYIQVWQNFHTTLYVGYAVVVFGTLFALTLRTRHARR